MQIDIEIYRCACAFAHGMLWNMYTHCVWHVDTNVNVLHEAEASDRHGLGHCALGLRKTAQLDPERVFAQGWHPGVLEPPGLCNPCGISWHSSQFMPSFCMSSKQSWTTAITESLHSRGRPGGPAPGDWKWLRSARDNGRRSREWPRLGQRNNQQLYLTYRGGSSRIAYMGNVA